MCASNHRMSRQFQPWLCGSFASSLRPSSTQWNGRRGSLVQAGGLMRDRLGGAAAPNQCSIQSALGLISAQQPDFTEKPADEGVAARALEREHVLEDRRELFT